MMKARLLARVAPNELPCPPRLFAVDVDGTLLTSDHRITALTQAVIARTRAAGAEVVLASSRPPQALDSILRQLELVEPVVFIASQGAVIGTACVGGGLGIRHRESLPMGDAKRFARDAMEAGRTVSWFTPTNWFVSRIDEDVRLEAKIVGLEPVMRDLDRLDEPPDKLMLMSMPDGPLTTDAPGLAIPASLQAQGSSARYVEITKRGVDKSTALRRYCEEMSIDAAAVAAIGDGPNDFAMFEYAGLSVAPANARPEVLAKVQFVTLSNDEEGVAVALTALMRLPMLSSDSGQQPDVVT